MISLNYLDLFSGCGGFSEGFNQCGESFNGLAHIEWEIPMINTLRNRLEFNGISQEQAIKKVVHFDLQRSKELIDGSWGADSIRKYSRTNSPSIISNKLIDGSQKVNVIIGGPPCQAYSIAGRAQDKNGMRDDYRNFLFESFVDFVDFYKPDVFVFENVPGILSANPSGSKPILELIYESFDKIGYEIRRPTEMKKSVYDSSNFGVPQKRKRVIIFGVNKKGPIKLEKLYSNLNSQLDISYTKTVFDAFETANLPKFYPNNSGEYIIEGSVSDVSFQPRIQNVRDQKIFYDWINLDMNSRPLSEKIAFYQNRVEKTTKHNKYRSLEWDKVSPTIVAHLEKDGLMFIHPDKDQKRTITVREAAILQSFPMNYKFLGSKGYQYRMIGNAVPPLLGKAIGISILKSY
jgi:DNA (cytosine-5)-methyltransferase 1